MIPIYKSEIELGLADAIASSCVFAYNSPVIAADKEILENWIKFAPKGLQETFASNHDSFDLYTIYTILVTVGWNKNDDIFDRLEVFNASRTPEDKPFNLEHIPSQIIGHITGSRIVDEKLQVLAEDVQFEDLPSKFHILTSSVIYKHLQSREPELTEKAAQLIKEIENSEWCVSMEALFSDFDYGLTCASGEQKIIARCEGTSFLTKYLRIYGGDGVYNNNKIGRVLKNITFSGKGLVKKPANPESIIINDIQQFAGVIAKIETLDNKVQIQMEKELQDKINALEAQLTAAQKTIEGFNLQQSKAELEAKNAEIIKLTDAISAHNTKIDELAKAKTEVEAAKSELENKLAETEKNLTEANTKLVEIAAQAKITSRVLALTEAGVEKESAQALVDKFAALDDAMFTEIVNMQSEIAAKKKEKEKEMPHKEGCKADDASVDPAGAAAAEAVSVEAVKPDEEPALSVNNDNETKDMLAGIAAYLGQKLKK